MLIAITSTKAQTKTVEIFHHSYAFGVNHVRSYKCYEYPICMLAATTVKAVRLAAGRVSQRFQMCIVARRVI